MIRIQFPGTKVKDGFVQFQRIIGATLIDVELRTGENSYVEESDSLILHFSNGSELLIWGEGEATIYAEDD